MGKKRTNYAKAYDENQTEVTPVEEVVEETVEETVEEVVEEVVKEPVIGTVTNCTKLNVRKSPKNDAPVLCMIAVSDKVVVDEEKSVGKFYKVCTPAGVEGYCMKDYITIK